MYKPGAYELPKMAKEHKIISQSKSFTKFVAIYGLHMTKTTMAEDF